MNPAPPVTSTLIAELRATNRLATDRVVLEAEPPHPLCLPEVAAVEDDRPTHHAPEALEVEKLELVPLGDERDSVGARRGGVGRVGVLDQTRQNLARVGHRDRIVDADRRAELDQ